MSEMTRHGMFGLPLSDHPDDYPPTEDEDPSFYEDDYPQDIPRDQLDYPWNQPPEY